MVEAGANEILLENVLILFSQK